MRTAHTLAVPTARPVTRAGGGGGRSRRRPAVLNVVSLSPPKSAWQQRRWRQQQQQQAGAGGVRGTALGQFCFREGPHWCSGRACCTMRVILPLARGLFPGHGLSHAQTALLRAAFAAGAWSSTSIPVLAASLRLCTGQRSQHTLAAARSPAASGLPDAHAAVLPAREQRARGVEQRRRDGARVRRARGQRSARHGVGRQAEVPQLDLPLGATCVGQQGTRSPPQPQQTRCHDATTGRLSHQEGRPHRWRPGWAPFA